MEKFVAEDIIAAVDRIVAYSPTERVFFAYWAWWEALGKPNDFLGEKMLVLCPQDNKWHTPQEIKKKGWDRPVRRGEWIEVQTGKWHGWKCSECGKIVKKKTKLKWCFNCGAKMKERV